MPRHETMNKNRKDCRGTMHRAPTRLFSLEFKNSICYDNILNELRRDIAL